MKNYIVAFSPNLTNEKNSLATYGLSLNETAQLAGKFIYIYIYILLIF